MYLAVNPFGPCPSSGRSRIIFQEHCQISRRPSAESFLYWYSKTVHAIRKKSRKAPDTIRMRRQKRKRRQAKTQWTILRQHRLRMMPRMRHRASRMRLKAVQLPAKCSLRHMTSYNILLSNPSFPIHCSHEVSGSRPRVLCRPRHRHG